MPRTFTVTFDYRSPFAYIVADGVYQALDAGADWSVAFMPFSLAQAHVEEGYQPLWSRKEPTDAPGVLALLAGLYARVQAPERFRDVHLGLFSARFDAGRDINDPAVVRAVLASAGVDPQVALAGESMSRVLPVLRDEHELLVGRGVFGVPCLLAGDHGALVRYTRHFEDAPTAIRAIESALELLALGELDEFKRPPTRRPKYAPREPAVGS